MSSDVKRKGAGEQHDDSIISSLGSANAPNLDFAAETAEMLDEAENDPNRRCVDLIVLGISYRSLEADVKKCFEAFGELIFCEVRMTNSSEGHGTPAFFSPDQTRCQWAIAWFRFYSI